jgi:hypothetical protein
MHHRRSGRPPCRPRLLHHSHQLCLGRLVYAASVSDLCPRLSLHPGDLPSKTSIGTLLHQGQWAEEHAGSVENLDTGLVVKLYCSTVALLANNARS